MGVIDRALSAIGIMSKAVTDPQPATSSRLFFMGKTPAGVHVDAENALKNSVVWACIRYLSSTVAQLPWHVMRNIDGKRERMNTNRVDWLLSTRPCPEMGSFSWRQTMLGNALRYGNAYAEIERDARGAAWALWPIHPYRVKVDRDDDGTLFYRVSNCAGEVALAASDMFHIRGFGDGPVGFNVIEYAAESIGWARATEIFGASYFGEGMNPSGIITVPHTTPLSIEAHTELRNEIKRVYGGPKGERTAILDGGMEFKKVANTPEDSQFVETRQHQVEEICRWFGVPPHKVMHLLRATFSNIEHQSIEVVVDAVTPWTKVFEEEADFKLFGQNRQQLYTHIDLRGLLRGDHESRGKFYTTLAGLGWSLNEIRALEDFDGIGADGERRFISQQLKPIDEAGQTDAGTVDLTNPDAVRQALNRFN